MRNQRFDLRRLGTPVFDFDAPIELFSENRCPYDVICKLWQQDGAARCFPALQVPMRLGSVLQGILLADIHSDSP